MTTDPRTTDPRTTDPRTTDPRTTMAERPTKLSALADERYVSITTFRRDGTPVSTPVWVVSDDPHRLLVATGAGTWKIKRIKKDPHVRVAGCSARGKVHGEAVDGVARLVDERPLVRHLQHEKYGWQMRLIEAGSNLWLRVTRRARPEEAFIEIREGELEG
jgi:PPOX class probable F420-dependent enzyme